MRLRAHGQIILVFTVISRFEAPILIYSLTEKLTVVCKFLELESSVFLSIWNDCIQVSKRARILDQEFVRRLNVKIKAITTLFSAVTAHKLRVNGPGCRQVD